jgi:hypothetical protein
MTLSPSTESVQARPRVVVVLQDPIGNSIEETAVKSLIRSTILAQPGLNANSLSVFVLPENTQITSGGVSLCQYGESFHSELPVEKAPYVIVFHCQDGPLRSFLLSHEVMEASG